MRYGTRFIFSTALFILWGLTQTSANAMDIETFANPPADCRPQTRWWWLGNVLTPEEISWQLREMHAQGIRGVEQLSFEPEYEKGNIAYSSDEFFARLKHTITEAHTLDMTVSVNFGGPGWIWGGDWVPEDERTQCMLSSSFIVNGPARIDQALSKDATQNPRDIPRSYPKIEPEDKLIAVVVGKVVDGVIDAESLRDVSEQVHDRQITWDAPEGTWRVMAFWSTNPESSNAVNHIDKSAMTRYVETLGGKFTAALGEPLGASIESLFGDSFEVPVHRNGMYWADRVPEEFRARKGYNLVPNLPALWWDIGVTTPKVRYDVNDVLHQMGMEAFYDTFGAWCKAQGVKTRVQPYGFVTDVLEGARDSDIPEMEITAGEKDAVPWFDTRVGPREYVASGAHIYGRNIVSVEAYTYLHWEPYRATLEELKIATDIFLRAGANRFNNHGFTATPERDIAPTRGFYSAIHISPDNVWWPHYHHLSDYVARSSYLLRQGKPCADIAVYAPTANQWSLDALNARKWTRDFNWGELSRLILSNGYNYDLVNDDALQHLAGFNGQELNIGAMSYRILILPNIAAIPLESLRQIEAYAKQGGIVVALERVPNASCGMKDWQANDQQVRDITARMFKKSSGRDGMGIEGPSSKVAYGSGTTYWVDRVMDRSNDLDKQSSVFDPFLRIIRSHVAPDLSINFVAEALRSNDGLCFTHRQDQDRDIYFVANVQDRAVDMPIGFRVSGAAPSEWDPYTGAVNTLLEYIESERETVLPVRLAPYESTFFIFEHGAKRTHATSSTLSWIEQLNETEAIGYTNRAGAHFVKTETGKTLRKRTVQVPAPYHINAQWNLQLKSPTFSNFEKMLNDLISWTDMTETKHFSGTGIYRTDFEMPTEYIQPDIRLMLDLGNVGNVAEVFLNGSRVGTVWMRGQQLDLSKNARVNTNQIEICVTNTLINRVSALSEFPPVPKELQARLGRGLHDEDSPAYSLLGFTPLPRSGLLGPLTVTPYKRVELN